MQEVKNFISIINNYQFQEAQILLNKFELSDINFVDAEGNTLMHYTIRAILNFNISRKDFLTANKESNQAYEVVYQELKSALALIQKMLEINMPYIQKNNSQKTPLDFLKNIPDAALINKDIEANIVKLFDEKAEILHSGRKIVADISLVRNSHTPGREGIIPDEWNIFNDGLKLSLHQRLRLYSFHLQKYCRLPEAQNLVVANLSFLIKKDTKNSANITQPLFFTIPITDVTDLIYRVEGKHSEDALIDYLSKPEKLLRIVNKLALYYKPEEHKILLCVLDIDSTREVCFDCEKLLRKLQTDYDGNSFLKKLENLLGKTSLNKTQYSVDKGVCFTLPEKASDRNRRNEPSSNLLPKLPIVIRASGIIEASGGNFDHNHPLPLPCRQYNHNVKTHSSGVIFHLPPKNNEYQYSSTCNNFNKNFNEDIKTLYNTRVHSLDNVSLSNLRKNRFFSVFFQTAFSSSNGSLLKRTPNEKETFHQIKIEEPVHLTEEDLPRSLKASLQI